MEIKLIGLEDIPLVHAGDNIAQIIKDSILNMNYDLKDGDIILIAETLISKAEGNIIDLNEIEVSKKAYEIAEICKKDPKIVQVILDNSTEIVEIGPNFIICETKEGFVCANAAIDESNIEDGLATPIPENPDESALKIRRYLEEEFGKDLAVIVTDTQGRAFRIGAIGTAIGCSGINPLWVRIGEKDLYGRELETTEIATADELASAASLIMGQADEGLPVVIVSGFGAFNHLRDDSSNINPLIRPKEFDVFRK